MTSSELFVMATGIPTLSKIGGSARQSENMTGSFLGSKPSGRPCETF
jgi:hypothetical protein